MSDLRAEPSNAVAEKSGAVDAYARVTRLGDRGLTKLLVMQGICIVVSIELHSLMSVWIGALRKIAGSLDAISDSLGPELDAFGTWLAVWAHAYGAYVIVAVIAGTMAAVLLRGSTPVRVSTCVATALGGLLVLFAARSSGAPRMINTDDTPIEVTVDDPPPPPKTPEPEPTEEPEQTKPPPQPLATPTTPPPAPAAAQAGQVLSAPDDTPEDFSSFTIPVGSATSYAGGNTSSNGTSGTAVRSASAKPNGMPGGTGTANQPQPPPPPQQMVSHARAAGLTSRDWRCPFPPEADTAQIDEAVVQLEVHVRADGSVDSVRILSDPGNGFGRMAYQCALRQRFTPALDFDGNPIPGVVRPPVHFNR
jgi:protein TonB